MAKLVNRAKVSTATTGTGTITLGSAHVGYSTFAEAGVSDGDTVRYVIEEGTGFEIGTGTYTASNNTLTRSPTESSKADNTAISLGGEAAVLIAATKDDFVNAVEGGTFTGNVDFSNGIDVTGNVTVSGTVDGRDVAADGTKLDGIESGATADQTASEIRALVEAATDSNVFTDADHSKLNGIEAGADVTDTANVTSAGALMTTGGTMTGNLDVGGTITADNIVLDNGAADGGNLTFNSSGYAAWNMDNSAGRLRAYVSGSEKFTILASGSVGIGTTSPSQTLDVNGGVKANGYVISNDFQNRSSDLRFRDLAGGVICYFDESANTWLWRPDGTNERMRLDNTGLGVKGVTPSVALDVNGSIEYTGTITDVSDDRLKENKVQITGALDAIKSLTGYTYNMVYEDEDQTEMGLIAQDVQAVLPVAVKNIKIDTDGDGTDEDYLGVSYIQLIAPMIEAIKEQQQQIEALQARIDVLEGA